MCPGGDDNATTSSVEADPNELGDGIEQECVVVIELYDVTHLRDPIRIGTDLQQGRIERSDPMDVSTHSGFPMVTLLARTIRRAAHYRCLLGPSCLGSRVGRKELSLYTALSEPLGFVCYEISFHSVCATPGKRRRPSGAARLPQAPEAAMRRTEGPA